MSTPVLILNYAGLGWLPTLIGPDGKVFREALLWIRSQFDQEKSPTTLRLQATALAKYVDYWDHYGREKEPRDIIRGYFRSLVTGDDELGWHPFEKPETAVQYLNYVNMFID